ncbi:MAG TPA: hypothetical protein PJ987_13595 [Bacteroidia bacterium]|jgi:hypothetical protein|nr:hypothetical protein [Bacteroidia bacterium]HMW11465.1 hypothetical protein [Bacteroidia bacterium]
MAKASKPKKEKEVTVEPEVITEVVTETPEPEIVQDNEPPVVEYVEERQPDIIQEESKERAADDTIEASILKYLDSKGEGEHLLNDFLKSLFPIPKFNEPAIYLTQENSRYIRHVLENMQLECKINIVNDLHRKLGEHWYEPETGIARRHNLSTVKIVAKK